MRLELLDLGTCEDMLNAEDGLEIRDRGLEAGKVAEAGVSNPGDAGPEQPKAGVDL